MNIAVACGGTGGHIFPGMATAKVLRGRGHDVTLWLGGRDVEALSAKGWDGEVVRVVASGFPSGLSLRAVRSALRLGRAVRTCSVEMKRRRPDVFLGMGSYSSVGPALAARIHRIPVVLHEANAVPGRAVTFLARYACCVGLTFEESRRYFRVRTVVTGLPLRDGMTEGAPMEMPGDGATVLVMGGSLGAEAVNAVASEAVRAVHAGGDKVQVIHLTGTRQEEEVRAAYEAAGVSNRTFGFLSDMPAAYSRADLPNCRTGASSCMELAVTRLPALFVPLPSAARDHQTANAKAMVAVGGADMKPQGELTSEWLADYIRTCVRDETSLTTKREALAKLDVVGAAEKLADLVEEAGADRCE